MNRPQRKDDGTLSLTDWADENMIYVVVYGNRQNGVPVEYVSEREAEEGAQKLARWKRVRLVVGAEERGLRQL